MSFKQHVMYMIKANFFMSEACVGVEIETLVFQVCDGRSRCVLDSAF